jgi:hypothetical protein
MSEFEALLKQEHNTNGTVSPECKEKTLEYIASNETICHKEMLFIKHLTKVASLILKEDDSSLNGFLERIYKYNLEGIRKIESETFNDFDAINIQSLHSHFYSHASNIARKIFELAEDPNWAKIACEYSEKSALLADSIDTVHTANAYLVSAILALDIFEITKELEYGEKCFDFSNHTIFLTGDCDLIRCSSSNRSASIAAKHICEHYEGIDHHASVDWAKKQFEYALEAAFLIEDSDAKNSSWAYGFAADAARELLKLEGNIDWAFKWFNNMMRSAHISKDVDPKTTAYLYGFAGDAANSIFKFNPSLKWAGEHLDWLDVTYRLEIKSAVLSAETDKKHSAVSYSYAGDAAKIMIGFVPDPIKRKEWADNAIEAYSRFLDYCRKHPDMKKSEKRIAITEERIEEIKRFEKE